MEPTNDSIRDVPKGGIAGMPWRHFDVAVVACIIALAVILGILNNLRVADERKAKWFGAPADRTDLETAREAAP